MKVEKDIHGYAAITARYVKNIKASSEIDEKNKADLLRYANSLKELSPGTQSKNLQVMFRVAKLLDKPFKKTKREDIDKVLSAIMGNDLTIWSRCKYKSVLKAFFKWLYVLEDEYPDQVKHVRARKPQTNGVPMDRLNLEDFRAMLQAAPTPIAKFTCSYFMDTGARTSELGSQNIENCEDRTDYLSAAITDSKTQPRSLPLKNCKPYLLDYLEVHPNPKPGQPLLMDKNGKRLNYATIRRILLDAGKRAGITKPCNPHHIRRSVATIYGQFFHENEMDKWFGWGKTKISNVYVQFSGKQMLEAYNRFWESDKNILRQIICPDCKTLNAGTLQYCSKCQKPLLEKTVLNAKQEIHSKATELMNEAIKDPKVLKRMAEIAETMIPL